MGPCRESVEDDPDDLRLWDALTGAADEIDRLAELEQRVRALADHYHAMDANQPGSLVRADLVEEQLRALLYEDGK